MTDDHIKISLPDVSVKTYHKGVTGLEIATSISEGLARNVLAAKVGEEVWDATRPILHDASVQLLTWNDKEGKSTFWHSSAHLMAEALESLFPGVKFGIGPAIDSGFYYDVDFGDQEFDPLNDIPRIEEKMMELARQKNDYKREEISKSAAIDFFTKKGDVYKI